MKNRRAPLRLPPQGFLIYLQMRLRCRLRRWPSAADFQRFANLTLDQIAHALSEKGYGEEARALAISQRGSDFLRAIVRQHMENEIAKLARICRVHDTSAVWLEAYRWKYDLHLLRAALRARQQQAEIFSDCLTPFANLPFAAYQALAQAPALSSGEPALLPFVDTPFGAMLDCSEPALDELEVALCHDFYADTLGAMRAATAGHKAAEDFIDAEAHLANLLTLLAGRRSGASPEKLSAQMIAVDFWAKPEAVRRLVAAPDAAALQENLEALAAGMGRRNIFSRQAVDSEEALAHMLRRRLRHLAQKVIANSETSPLAAPAYVFCLECEAINLNLLAVAHDGGIGAEERRAMLVA